MMKTEVERLRNYTKMKVEETWQEYIELSTRKDLTNKERIEALELYSEHIAYNDILNKLTKILLDK